MTIQLRTATTVGDAGCGTPVGAPGWGEGEGVMAEVFCTGTCAQPEKIPKPRRQTIKPVQRRVIDKARPPGSIVS
jgi:hypothetical protein